MTPELFFVTHHLRGHPLAALKRATKPVLRERLEPARRMRPPPCLVAAYDEG